MSKMHRGSTADDYNSRRLIPACRPPVTAPPATPPNLTISQFDYALPEELIAQFPAPERSASRLLHLDAGGRIHDRQFADLPQILRAGDLLVFNNTRVIKARLHGRKASGGKVEILVERLTSSHTALAHIKASKSPKAGGLLVVGQAGDGCGEIAIRVTGRQGALFELAFAQAVMTVLDACGQLPLPPYITHTPQAQDTERYQTVYAHQPGAVAAPTAGLHFDEAMLTQLREQGVQHAFVTLHVGAGTFQPVRVETLADHVMHAEWYSVPPETLTCIQATRAAGGRVIAVGTTSVRALESAALESAQPQKPSVRRNDAPLDAPPQAPLQGDTRLFITPGYRFRLIDALISNFHLPRSTLLVLVSALAGLDPIQRAYAHAIAQRYRFFSYGDAMFIESPHTCPPSP